MKIINTGEVDTKCLVLLCSVQWIEIDGAINLSLTYSVAMMGYHLEGFSQAT